MENFSNSKNKIGCVYMLTPNGIAEKACIAGMFVMFDSVAFQRIGGFNEKYYMYMEDVDICLRLAEIGKKVLWVPSCNVVHNAQRASRVSWQHRRWHVRSLVRFIFGL